MSQNSAGVPATNSTFFESIADSTVGSTEAASTL